jgi:LuxR family maltose regulon positive regulatory protein
LDEAGQAYAEAARIGQAAGNVHVAIIANAHLAETLFEQGKLRETARSYAETLRLATGANGQPMPLAERVYAGLSRVSYEQNDLAAAAQQAHHCLELSRTWGSVEFEAVGHVMLARLAQAQCHPEDVRPSMHAAEQLVDASDMAAAWSIWTKAALARLWLAQGNLERPSHYVETSGITADDDIPFLREPEYLILLRLLQARGENDRALALSERWIHKVEATRRTGRVVELFVLEALVFQGQKDTAKALDVLARAIAMAQPEGYVRVFLDEGEPMARLLYLARSRHNGAGYAAELLSALGDTGPMAQLPTQHLIEPLTARELEVLKLIQAGHSNQAIAVELVVSLGTVKRHISNVYAKLGAKSRTQAVSLGRELKLFE